MTVYMALEDICTYIWQMALGMLLDDDTYTLIFFIKNSFWYDWERRKYREQSVLEQLYSIA